MVRFSIITICYNSEKTIERTLQSVLAQTYSNYEYIVVDGASKDRTLSIVKRYEPLFEGRMKWVSEPDNGIYDAMNKGIKAASGDIVAIVNSDDWLEYNALQLVYDSYNANGQSLNSLYCGGINFIYSDGNIRKWKVNLQKFYRQVNFYVMAGIRHPGTFVPLNVYRKVGFFNEMFHIAADTEFILRCYYEKINFFDVGAVVSNMSEGGISTSLNRKLIRKNIEDRILLLNSFGIKGFKYIWLYYSWRLRFAIRNISIRIGLYK